jgi:uncharacterized membrane protein
MSTEAVIGILIAIVIGLIGIIYGLLRSEDKRIARNVHALRNTVQSIIMTLAARGIRVKKQDEEDE